MRTLPAVLLLALAAPAHAQLPHARLDRLFPLGGKAGSSVVVEAQGKDLDDLTALHLDRPGFKAERLKGNQFRLSIPADAAPGTVEVRTVGRHGISAARLFAVQKGLEEVQEKEPNDSADKAQVVPLDCAVNGTSDGDGDDFFRFAAKKGQRVVLDCWALRLDSTLRASLVLSDAWGKELARSRPYHLRTDPLLDVLIPADGDYVVGIHDATYSGGLPYRLVITTKPQVENVFPFAVEAGKSATLAVLGRNLPASKPYAGGQVLDRDLDLLNVSYAAPKDPLGLFNFLAHPSSPAAKLRGLQLWPKGLDNAVNPATLIVSSDPVTVEKEPNDSADRAQPITLPTVLCGRLDRPGDADWYTFTAKAGEQVAIDLWCERLEMPGDPYVIVSDEKGNELAQFDDHGISFNALALYNRDPVGTFSAPANGKYRLLIQDRYRQGGPRFGYACRVGKPVADIYPVVFHATNPDPTSPLVRAGGSDHVEVCLNRKNFNGPAVIEAKDLPPGVSCPPVHVSPQTEYASVVFTASADARDWQGAVRLTAAVTVDGKKVTREVRAVQRRWALANVNTSRLARELTLAVRPGAPYGLRLPEKAAVAAGGSIDLDVGVKRAGDFTGKIQLTGLNLPPGFGFATAEVAEGKPGTKAKLTVAANVPPGTYTVVLRGDAQVPLARDEKAKKVSVRVADPSTPLTLTVTAPAKKK